ncbi:MAG: hypothetical protein KHW87_01990 [Clostridiales bacterium]|nr:hypothetical protein [Clostridiales bacterium]
MMIPKASNEMTQELMRVSFVIRQRGCDTGVCQSTHVATLLESKHKNTAGYHCGGA